MTNHLKHLNFIYVYLNYLKTNHAGVISNNSIEEILFYLRNLGNKFKNLFLESKCVFAYVKMAN